MDILEKEIEKKLVARLKQIGCVVLKLVSPGSAGVPDRYALCPGGRSVFIEVKRPGGKLRPLQLYWKKKLEDHGAAFYLVDSFEAIEKVVSGIEIQAAHVPAGGNKKTD